MNILIPNATGPTNIGDQAILLPLIDILKKKFPNAHITLHSATPYLYKKKLVDHIDSHLYYWAVFENRSTLERTKRVGALLIAYSSLRLRLPLLAHGTLKKLLENYLYADLIVYIGGGYFRSQKGISQSLNLLMICLLFQFGRVVTAKKIIAPISFGPFAYNWQENYVAKIISGFDVIATREDYSYKLLKKYKISNIIHSTDTALFLPIEKRKSHPKAGFILGFTIRKWLDSESQKKFETSFSEAIIRFDQFVKTTVQPIVQVDAPQYGDVDASLTTKIVKDLRSAKLKINETKTVTDLQQGAKIYGNVDILLGMRMHSNILAALSGTPFVAISYEHKTDGLTKDLGVEDYVIKCEDVNSQNLYALLKKAYTNREQLKKTINTSVSEIRQKETERWNNVFQTV
jgi:colanic acid/amylovoran biosynthesis protein